MSDQVTFAHLDAGVDLLGDHFGFRDPDNPEGILGFGSGWLARDGVWQQQFGLVLLAAAGKPGFPYKHITVEAEGTEAEVPCCALIIEPYAGEAATPVVVPGEPALQPGAPLAPLAGYRAGTFACALGSPARSLLTAAHVFDFDLTPRSVFCGPREIGQISSRQDERFDLACVDLKDDATTALAQAMPDGTAVAGVGHLSWEDLRHRAQVYRPTQGSTAKPWILAGDMTLHLLQREGAVMTQTDMIMTESCTHPGDSGTALLDRNGWVLGVLSHGRKDFSFFTSVASLRNSPLWPEAT